MNLEELYDQGDPLPVKNERVRELLQGAYWRGVDLAKMNGLPELSAADTRAMIRAVSFGLLEGFEKNRDYSKGAQP